MNNKRLMRTNNKMFLGVAGGIAEYFGIDPTIIRILWVVFAFATSFFPAILTYVVLAIIMPEDNFVGKVQTEEVDYDEEVIVKDA
ncbi:MAG: PspC domain-containing protein [Anaerolineae bacterium]|nr:PspC domain-containing protein [Anaerolineae bacterium]MCO5190648.1 PspC domain-containing protein [Anaerolineae bacterium]MCO5199046.1 PspC domain-containing protein [Anaerolineae bacterium]MCO5207998.1 PspC domain-containing protein [Anaerolineae bacterium]